MSSPLRQLVTKLAELTVECSQKLSSEDYAMFCQTLDAQNLELAEEDEGMIQDTWSQYKK